MPPQKRQVQKSCGLSCSPHFTHAQPVDSEAFLAGRTSRHALHCRVSGSLTSVHRGHAHGWSPDNVFRLAVEPTLLTTGEGGGVLTFGDDALRAADGGRERERRPAGDELLTVLAGGRDVLLFCFLGEACTIFEMPPVDVGSSRMTTSESESAVRSMTSSSMLSRAAFSASLCASSPKAQDFSSRNLRSAA